MERHTPQGGEFQDAHQPDEQEQAQPLSDQARIYQGITDALRDGCPIDHATARAIAAQLHGGQGSPLYALASSGAVVDGIGAELDSFRTDDAPVELEPWLDALEEYLTSRDDLGPVDGWAKRWPGGQVVDERQEDIEQARDAAHHERVRNRERLERYVEAGLDPSEAEALIEFEDAMQAQPAGGQAEATPPSVSEVSGDPPATTDDEPEVSSQPSTATDTTPAAVEATGGTGEQLPDDTARTIATDLMETFTLGPDSELALFVATGAIWNENDALFRELYANWDEHTPDQQASVEALRRYVLAVGDRPPQPHWGEEAVSRETTSGIQPEIWVGSLSDYTNGLLHGMWVDADQEPDDLMARISWILRTSPYGRTNGQVAEEWAILDHSGFCGYQVSEWSSLDTVSLVAKGIAEHGAPYAAWVEYVGDQSGELLDDDAFRDHYEGEWESLEAYVEHVLDETDVMRQLDGALATFPEDLRRYVSLDIAGIAEEWQQGLYVVEAPGGWVWVFDTSA